MLRNSCKPVNNNVQREREKTCNYEKEPEDDEEVSWIDPQDRTKLTLICLQDATFSFSCL